MIHKESLFLGHDETPLYWQCWYPDQDPKAIIVFIHGFGDHSSRHVTLISHVVSQGYAVYSYDSRGNGQSPGKRGHIDSWDQYRSDLRTFIHDVVELHGPELPLFLMGFSMGGLTALEYILHYPENFDGVIAASAPLGNVGVSPILMKIGRVMNCIMPSFTMDMGIDRKWICRDYSVVETHMSDRLNHGRASARLGVEFEHAIEWTQARAAELAVPLLVLHGSQNKIADPRGSREFYNNVLISDKQYILYDGAYHELDDELCKDEVLRDLTDWMNRHLDTGAIIKERVDACLAEQLTD